MSDQWQPIDTAPKDGTWIVARWLDYPLQKDIEVQWDISSNRNGWMRRVKPTEDHPSGTWSVHAPSVWIPITPERTAELQERERLQSLRRAMILKANELSALCRATEELLGKYHTD